MSMKSLGLLTALAAMGGMDGMGSVFGGPKQMLTRNNVDVTPAAKVLPNGCLDYWFNAEGEAYYEGCDRRPMLKTDTVYHCVASSLNAAKKKFGKFKKK